jgi:ferrous iron transport protein B
MNNRSPEVAGCHGSRSQAARSGAVTVALVGMPNTGKSTLYNRLTGGDAQIANWPGLTVELLRGRLPDGPDGRPWELVDLPGIHDLTGGSDDEAIVQRFLTQTPPDGVLVVLNASHITSQLRLLLDLSQLNLPLLLALNMIDEAERFGIHIDTQELSRRLGVPVLAISARQRRGLADLRQQMRQRFDPALTAQQLTPAGQVAMPQRQTLGPASPAELQALLQGCVQMPEQPRNRHSRRVDRWLLHPLVGPLVFLLIVLLMFQAIYALGAPLQEVFGHGFDAVRNGLLTPLLALLQTPPLLASFLLDGVWLGISTVVSFLPIIFLFYLVMAIVEDSGYLPRAAF